MFIAPRHNAAAQMQAIRRVVSRRVAAASAHRQQAAAAAGRGSDGARISSLFDFLLCILMSALVRERPLDMQIDRDDNLMSADRCVEANRTFK